MWENKTPRLLHQVSLPPSLLSPDQAQQPSQWAFVLKKMALLGPPTHPATAGCSQPSGAASLAHNNQRRCLRKSDQGAREEGREERAGDRKPREALVGPGQSHLGSISCLYSLASLQWGELCFQLRCDLPSKYLQILFPNSPGCLVENQFVLFSNN